MASPHPFATIELLGSPRPLRRRPLLAALLVAAVALSACVPWPGAQGEPDYQRRVLAVAGGDQFDFVRWEVEAVAEEARDWLFLRVPGPESVDARSRVLTYLERARLIQALRGEEEQSASLGQQAGEQSRPLSDIEAELTALRAAQAASRPAVERVLEAQVTAVLGEEGLGWLGTSLPPPLFSFSEPPLYLVVSRRDEIATRTSAYLDPALPMEERERIEAAVEALDDNTSALVDDTGGFSTWPTMLVDWADTEWILSTIAHEWAHVYLMPYPIGQRYYDNSDTTAINETVADMVGDELGHLAFVRFYEDVAPSAPEPTTRTARAQTSAFDFNGEMRLTRERVDALLAAGEVDEAERYMEERRLVFVEHGSYIRRLNQAYFAFHGSYRTGPEAPSEDPVAPRLRRLRQESTSLAAFLQAVQPIASLDDLIALVPAP